MKKVKNKAALKWIGQAVGRRKLNIAIMVVFQAVIALLSVASALFMKEVVNAAVDGNKERLINSGVAIAVITLITVAVQVVNQLYGERTRNAVEMNVRDRLFGNLLIGDYAEISKMHSGEWLNRLTSDTSVVTVGILQIIPGLVRIITQAVAAIIAISLIQWRFLPVIIVCTIALSLMTMCFRNVLKRRHVQIQEAEGALRSYIQERLGNLMLIKVFSKERQTMDEQQDYAKELNRKRMSQKRISAAGMAGYEIAINAAYIGGLIYCCFLIFNGELSYGGLIALMQLVGMVQSPMSAITAFMPQYYAMIGSAERMMESEEYVTDRNLLTKTDAKRQKTEAETKQFYQNSFKEIVCENVCFSYDGKSENSVISNANFRIKKGQYVAFMGPSGCGKSTVLKLLMALYPVSSGCLDIVSEDDRRKLDYRDRSMFAYVPQSNQLMSGTIKEAVSFNDAAKDSTERVWEALKIACADDFVKKFEQGLETKLMERGAGISEGQMQRLAIARAIYTNRPILILDEATSALDEATESALISNLRNMTDKTVIIVTHRRAVLSICDLYEWDKVVSSRD